MARKRMFSQDVIASDAFLSLSVHAQCLYFHLNLYADDEGFVQNPKMIMRILGSTENALKELDRSNYIHLFPSGVVLIVHWFIHNDIRKDRLHETVCLKERSKVTLSSRSYEFCECGVDDASMPSNDSINEAEPQTSDSKDAAQYSIDQYSLDKSSLVQYSALPLKNGSEYVISKEKAEELQGKYPNLNLSQSFMNMRNWLLENPNRQREESRMDAFITNWLNNEQNGYGRRSSYGQAEHSSEVTPVLGTVL